MKRITLTCPFTGVSFEATETADGNIISYNPLTGDEIWMKYNGSNRHYYIRPDYWRKTETLTFKECAERLNVTIQRVSALVKNGQLIPHILPNGEKVILETDLTAYNENRKYGRPRKKDNENA